MTIIVFATCLSVLARKDESLAEMMSRVDGARPEEGIPLAIQIARKELEVVAEANKSNHDETARAALADLLTYAGKASETSLQSNKKLKDTEIALRKIAERLRDLKRSADFEQQAPLQEASERLENMRTQLLSKMFAKKERK